jgi:competence transcription factor ComK
MDLDAESVEEFKTLYFKEYGIQLTNQQATEFGMSLINFVKAVYGNNLPKIKIDNNPNKANNINVLK